MFSRILIANRGEIALRIIRACKELGIETIAVYSEADADAIHLDYADERICIGPPINAHSYLNIPNIISAAEIADVEAIHPGYGFLAENSHFAEVCRSCNIQFIGPSVEAMTLVGNKLQARQIAQSCNVPVIPGSDTAVTEDDDALALAHKIGFPIMIKAAAGGGGRGIRIAHNSMSLANSIIAARNEAMSAFKDATVYLEHFLGKCRHVEIQIMADHHGNIVHLGERDCSIQRRHQKLLEECPSISVDDALRQKMGEDAKKIARAADYTNIGTVEFLLDEDGHYYFIEVNARIQVEHPITEMVTGIDLVKEQLRIASGEPLTIAQEDVVMNGHAIECRINAEDPDKNFHASAGTIGLYKTPGGTHVRVDTHAHGGYRIPPNYDSLLAKLIVWAPTRAEAISRMRSALEEYVIKGIKTTIPFHLDLLSHHQYIHGKVDTYFVEDQFL